MKTIDDIIKQDGLPVFVKCAACQNENRHQMILIDFAYPVKFVSHAVGNLVDARGNNKPYAKRLVETVFLCQAHWNLLVVDSVSPPHKIMVMQPGQPAPGITIDNGGNDV